MFRSLHARMLALSALATLVALAVAAWAITGVLERFVVEGLDRQLDAELALLASTVDSDGRVDRSLVAQRRAVLDGGPGWRWRILATNGTIGSEDFPPLDPGPPAPPPIQDGAIRPREGRDEGGVRLHAREATIETARGPVTLTVAAPRDVVRRPIRGALMPLLAALALLAVLLGGAAVVQLRLGLKPLRKLRDEVAAIRAGRQARVDEDQPSELRPLARELNALAGENDAALAAARQSAANLAHALKTPVATLALDLRDEPDRATLVARIDDTIRHHLARARAEVANRRVATPLAPAAADLIAAVRRLHAGRSLAIDAEVADDLAVAVDPKDLDELIGNLLDNAARHARTAVRLRALCDPTELRHLRIEITDDGPGIPVDRRASAVQAGVRLDERGGGHGFGLAIVSELAALYGGTLMLDEAEGGGLRAILTLPAARANE